MGVCWSCFRIPNHGDYFLIGKESIIIIRDKDNSVHAITMYVVIEGLIFV